MPHPDSARVSTSGLAVLRVMLALAGHAVGGQSNGDLATALSMTPSAVNRAVNTLIYAGLARKLDTGRFALTAKFAAIARSTDQQIETAKTRLAEMDQAIRATAAGLF